MPNPKNNILKLKVMKWKDLTLRQFNELSAVQVDNEEEKVIEYARIVFGDEILDLPLSQFAEKIKDLEFLNEELVEKVPPKKITINNREYEVSGLLGSITTAQYIDFNNHLKTRELNKMLSVFVIPKGHKYNDGYDMEEVMEDIMDMPITIVNNLSAFFLRQYDKSIRVILSYLTKKVVNKTKMSKEEKRLMEALLRVTELSLTPSSFVKLPTTH